MYRLDMVQQLFSEGIIGKEFLIGVEVVVKGVIL